MSVHPPLTWGQVKSWAEANGITDDHLVVDQRHVPVRDLSETGYWPQEDAIRAGETSDTGRPAIVFQVRWG